jgi:transcriptional regulator with XRE-family HTH domain
MNVAIRRSVGFRLRKVRERLGWDRTELADKLGVHPGSIARWETGGSVPHRYHVERIAEWGDVDPDWLLTGHEAGGVELSAPPQGEDGGEEAEEMFASLDSIARFVGGIGPAGQEKLRKLDALEGLRRMLTARGLLPNWWYELRDRVEGDEL